MLKATAPTPNAPILTQISLQVRRSADALDCTATVATERSARSGMSSSVRTSAIPGSARSRAVNSFTARGQASSEKQVSGTSTVTVGTYPVTATRSPVTTSIRTRSRSSSERKTRTSPALRSRRIISPFSLVRSHEVSDVDAWGWRVRCSPVYVAPLPLVYAPFLSLRVLFIPPAVSTPFTCMVEPDFPALANMIQESELGGGSFCQRYPASVASD